MNIRTLLRYPVEAGDRRLLAAAVLLQVVCIAVPTLVSVKYSLLLSLGLLGFAFVLFSVERSLLALLVLTIVLPNKVLLGLVLPGGVRLQEAAILVAIVFALIDLCYQRRLNVRLGALDVPALAFLALILFAVLNGLLHGHSTSILLREARYPFYYIVYFLVSNFVDEERIAKVFVPVLLAAALVVSFEYILEFIGAINLSTGSRFVRVVRLQGLILPIALLLIVNLYLHDPRRYGRVLLVVGALPIALAFVLTVGRGMWVATGVGLLCSVFLHHFNQPVRQRKIWHTLMLVAAVLGLIVGTSLAFQRFTGASIGAHALERSRTFIDPQRDMMALVRLSAHLAALEAIAQHPFIGNGMGSTIIYPTINIDTGLPDTWTTWAVDSVYLTLLFKMGLAGLLVFAWFYQRGLRLAYRIFKRAQLGADRAFGGGVLAVLVAMAILGMTDGSLVNGRFTLVFAVLLGFVSIKARRLAEGS